VKRWADEDTGEMFTTLYLPDMIIRYRAANSRTNKFDIDQVLPNPLGAVPIVPMVNRGRLLNREGRSELASIAPIADGINKLATDMMVTSEFYQTPAGGRRASRSRPTARTGAVAGRGCRLLGAGHQEQDVAGRRRACSSASSPRPTWTGSDRRSGC
jgi:hypothetical protein